MLQKRFLLGALVFAICSTSSTIHAGETEEAQQNLQAMRMRIDFIRRTGLHSQDEGRALVLDKATSNIVRSINENGILSAVTLNLYKHMVIKFRYSSQYFEFIRTIKTEQSIRELLEIVAKIRKKLQLEEDPYSTVLKSNLTQMLEAMDFLRKLSEVEEGLKEGLVRLRPEIGEAIAIAELGDRPKAFAAAAALYFKVQKLYPEIQGITSKVGYGVAIEILGLNEFIAEYAQIEKP